MRKAGGGGVWLGLGFVAWSLECLCACSSEAVGLGALCLDTSTGKQRWFREGAYFEALISGEQVDLTEGRADGAVFGLDLNTGAARSPRAAARAAKLATTDDFVFVSQDDGSVLRLAIDDDPSRTVRFAGASPEEVVTVFEVAEDWVAYQTAPKAANDVEQREGVRQVYLARQDDGVPFFTAELAVGDRFRLVDADSAAAQLLVARFVCGAKSSDPNSQVSCLSREASLVGMASSDGAERWRQPLRQPIDSVKPLHATGTFAVANDSPSPFNSPFNSCDVYSQRDGSLLWRTTNLLIGALNASSALFVDSSGALRARDVETGATAWKRSVKHEPKLLLTQDAAAFLLLPDKSTVRGDREGFCALNAGDGSERWCADLVRPAAVAEIGHGVALLWAEPGVEATRGLTMAAELDGAGTDPPYVAPGAVVAGACVGELSDVALGFGPFQGCPRDFASATASQLACNQGEQRAACATPRAIVRTFPALVERGRSVTCTYSQTTNELVGARLDWVGGGFCDGLFDTMQAGEPAELTCSATQTALCP